MTNKTKHLIGFSLNLVALLAEIFIIVAFFLLPKVIEADVTVDHTLLFYSVVIAILGSLVGVVASLISSKTTKPINKTLSVIRSLSTTTTIFLLIFEITSILIVKSANILSPLLFIVLGIALINTVSTVCFEQSYKKNPMVGALSAIFTLVYCASSFVFANFLNIPWDMSPFQILGTDIAFTASTAAVYILITFVVGIVVAAFGNINSKPLVTILPEEEIEEVVYDTKNVTFTASEELLEGPADDEVTEDKGESVEITQADEDSEEEEEAEERKQAEIDKKNNYNDRPRIYHISKHKTTGKWQVKLATGKKAIKLFGTQAEAIAFAKTLVLSQGGSIRIHSLKGKIRKE